MKAAEITPRIAWMLAGLACGSLLLAGCGGGAVSGEAVADVDGADDASSDRAADFTLTGLDGAPWRLADSTGSVRLVDFWATWCAPCRDEVPMLNELHAEFADAGLTIVAISDADDPRDLVQEFVDDLDVQYLTLLGERDVISRYKVFGLPTAFLLDRDGNVVETYFGPKPRRALEGRIRELLDLPAAT